jgi:hypothetical protein
MTESGSYSLPRENDMMMKRNIRVKEQWCAGVHARNASRRLAYRRILHPRAGGGNARIVDSMSGKVARPARISPHFRLTIEHGYINKSFARGSQKKQ